MAAHCFCPICQLNPAPAAEQQRMLYEEVRGAPYPAGVQGYFIQFSDDPGFKSLTGREMFKFPTFGNTPAGLHVGISGVYSSSYDNTLGRHKALVRLGLGGRYGYPVVISP